MALAIELDDYSASPAHEVNDVGANGMLSPECGTRAAMRSQLLPEEVLGGRRPEPKQSGGSDPGTHGLVNA